VSLTSSNADSLESRLLTGFTKPPPSCRPVADGLDAAVSPRSLLHLTDATVHVAAYAAAFLFAVLVAAVSPFGFSWPYKQK